MEFDAFAWTFTARYLFSFLLGCHARHLIEASARSSSAVEVVPASGASAAGAAGAVALPPRVAHRARGRSRISLPQQRAEPPQGRGPSRRTTIR